jgi:hypothetical protein
MGLLVTAFRREWELSEGRLGIGVLCIRIAVAESGKHKSFNEE